MPLQSKMSAGSALTVSRRHADTELFSMLVIRGWHSVTMLRSEQTRREIILM